MYYTSLKDNILKNRTVSALSGFPYVCILEGLGERADRLSLHARKIGGRGWREGAARCVCVCCCVHLTVTSGAPCDFVHFEETTF